jgi:hypothetical protein
MKYFYTDLIISFYLKDKTLVDSLLYSQQYLSFGNMKPKLTYKIEERIIYIWDTFIYSVEKFGNLESYIELDKILTTLRKENIDFKLASHTVNDDGTILNNFYNDYINISKHLEGLTVVENNRLIISNNINNLFDIGNLKTSIIYSLKKDYIKLKDKIFHDYNTLITSIKDISDNIKEITIDTENFSDVNFYFYDWLTNNKEYSYVYPSHYVQTSDDYDYYDYSIYNSKNLLNNLYIITYYEYKK